MSFKEGKSHGLIDLKLKADAAPEHKEKFLVRLVNATGESGLASIIDGVSAATISVAANDDIHGVFSFHDASLTLEEGNKKVVVVVRTRGSAGKVVVPLRLLHSDDCDIEVDYSLLTCNSDNATEVVFNDGLVCLAIQIELGQLGVAPVIDSAFHGQAA